MPKAMKVRETDKPLGRKINQVMAEKNMAGDYAALARAFGVKPPSVYDWIDHERLGKDRYRKLVEWSGRSLDWWFDIPPPAEHVNVHTLHQPAPPPHHVPPGWPFSRSFAQYDALPDSDKGRVDGYLSALVDANAGRASSLGGVTRERPRPLSAKIFRFVRPILVLTMVLSDLLAVTREERS